MEATSRFSRGWRGAYLITLLTFPRFQELDDVKLFLDKVMPGLA